MFKRGISALVVPALLLLTASAVAAASAGAQSHTVNLRGLIDTISSTGTIGSPGATETDTGILSGTISGKSTKGAFYQYSTWGSGLMLTAHGVVFDPNGSIRYKLSAKFVPASGGRLSYSGPVTATGGTGVYENVHGRLTTSGTTLKADPDAATISMKGTLTY
jgi:hypothetical protein